jgi:hypothetical protein
LLGLAQDQIASLNDDRLGRCLDRLFQNDCGSIALTVAAHAVTEFGVKLDQLHNDSTTITFHGRYNDAAQEEKRKDQTRLAITWGHNKDHRVRCSIHPPIPFAERSPLGQRGWVIRLTHDRKAQGNKARRRSGEGEKLVKTKPRKTRVVWSRLDYLNPNPGRGNPSPVARPVNHDDIECRPMAGGGSQKLIMASPLDVAPGYQPGSRDELET